MIGYIYQTTNIVNGKSYIGKHYGEYDSTYLGSGMILKQAIMKYGKEAFTTVILVEATTEVELNHLEQYYITSLAPEYNIAKGGSGGDTLKYANPDRRKQIIEKRSSGLKTAWDNCSETKRKEWGDAISNAKKGKASNRPNFKHTDETKKRISESNILSAKNRPDSWYESHATNASSRKGKPNKACFKKVEIDGIVYESINQAAIALNAYRQKITKWIKDGKAKAV